MRAPFGLPWLVVAVVAGIVIFRAHQAAKVQPASPFTTYPLSPIGITVLPPPTDDPAARGRFDYVTLQNDYQGPSGPHPYAVEGRGLGVTF